MIHSNILHQAVSDSIDCIGTHGREAHMSAGGGCRQNGVAEAGDEDTGQLLLSQQRTLSSCQQHLSPAGQLQHVTTGPPFPPQIQTPMTLGQTA